MLRPETDRVSLEWLRDAIRAEYCILIELALGQIGHENFPNAGRAAPSHRVTTAIPVIEIADNRHALRIRCPHRKVHAGSALVDARVCTEDVPEPLMGAFADKILVQFADNRSEGVGILKFPDLAVGGGTAQPVVTLGHSATENALDHRVGR